ncbi:MAG: LytTR family transcriptional regulator DNA-binding domain-containing protein [Erysipelotrichaceae bacterium]|nr:LytTR family transcriptional regulator DNA-binding domain-containing protein [Erysipelotrichaceae bacterium]
MSLNTLEEETAGQDFFRCHKSYLINMHHISKIGVDQITMDNADKIPLSKHRRKDFLAAYSKMVGTAL